MRTWLKSLSVEHEQELEESYRKSGELSCECSVVEEECERAESPIDRNNRGDASRGGNRGIREVSALI